MKDMTAVAIIYVACCLAIAVAVFITKSGTPLWALLLIPSYKSDSSSLTK